MTTYDVGDWRTPALSVAPFDGTTVATLTITAPDLTVTHPTATTGDAGASWAAPTYQLTQAGQYIETWSVAGTGAGVQSLTVDVVPQPPASLAGSHATTADYARYIGKVPPGNLAYLLRKASHEVDRTILSTQYDAADATVLATLAEATCWQVDFWLINGWTDGQPPVYDSVSIGSVSLTRSSQGAISGPGNGQARLGADAWQVLQTAGLTGGAPWTG
jgi:hypothetical protein